MVQLNTKLKVFDNSGAKVVKCIRVLNDKTFSSFLLVSVKTLRTKQKTKTKIKKGSVLFAYLIKTTTIKAKFSGLKIKSETNGVVLVNKQLQPIASRLTGSIPKQLKLGKLKNMTLSGLIV
jgi:large subunit ribosomal protein L14